MRNTTDDHDYSYHYRNIILRNSLRIHIESFPMHKLILFFHQFFSMVAQRKALDFDQNTSMRQFSGEKPECIGIFSSLVLTKTSV